MIKIDRAVVEKSVECLEDLLEMDYNNTNTMKSKDAFCKLYHPTTLELLESLKSALEDNK